MIDNNSKISFVMPAHNSAKTIAEAVESVFNGNFEVGDEFIIVDNASSDSTRKVIRKLKTKYPLIIEIDNAEDKGCPASRNIGVNTAKNPIIFNLDSDNVLVPGSIKKLKEYLVSENADMAAFSEYHYFYKNNIKQITHKWICKLGVMSLADFLAGPINPGPGGNFMYTKESWKKVGMYWEYGKGVQEAWGFALKQLANGSEFVVLPNSYYLHRYGTNSLFVREAKNDGKSSLMATKMIMPFINLLNDEDASYIKSEEGSKNWLEYRNYINRPIRLKTGEIGVAGYKISLQRNNSLVLRVKSVTPHFFYNMIRKIYYSYLFLKNFLYFKKISKSQGDKRFSILWRDRKPMLFDKTGTTNFDAHYIYHLAWAARIVNKISPKIHIDISSSLTFSSMLSAFIPVQFYDYRPANIILSGLESRKANILSLPFPNDSVKSISCMHTVEHIGLGRYGDNIDTEGDIKAINELKRVATRGGTLIFVVPVGKPKLMYNAHRIYSFSQIVSYFKDFELKEFALIPDNALKDGIIINASKELADQQKYGCGCFWFVKK